ncbi:MAG: aminopeptidase P family protein [Clostridia bacterium]|nr:aminopeptidase P family protein [Clostridia bacterium]
MIKNRVLHLLSDMPEKSAIYLTDPTDMYYYSGFDGEGAVVIAENKKLIITDGRYTESALKKCAEFEVLPISDLYKVLNELNMPIIVQSDSLSYSEFIRLEKEGIEVKAKGGFDLLRAVKCDEEIKHLKKAAEIAEQVFEEVLLFIKQGKTEKETAAFIDYQMRVKGAEKSSFETICVSGKNTSLPHGVPTDKKFKNGEFITLDFGCKVNGYCSDMTRTVALGSVTDEMANVYDVVLKAHQKAVGAINPGAICKEIDKIARDYIKQNGYGEYFVHSLGHGVGLKIHENPVLSPKSQEVLKEGNVVTVEPGIYMPDKFGVRIENTVLVTQKSAQSLQKSSKELIIL